MAEKTAALRRLLAEEAFLHLPVAYDALGGRLIEKTGFKAAYVGGFVTGGSRCTSEPLLTLDEQVRVAGDVAKSGWHTGARRCRRRFWRAIAHDAYRARVRPCRYRRRPYRGPAVPQASALSQIRRPCDPAEGIRRQDPPRLPPARPDRQGFRDHRQERFVPVRGSRRSRRPGEPRGRARRRHGDDLPARPDRTAAGAEAVENPAGLRRQPR